MLFVHIPASWWTAIFWCSLRWVWVRCTSVLSRLSWCCSIVWAHFGDAWSFVLQHILLQNLQRRVWRSPASTRDVTVPGWILVGNILARSVFLLTVSDLTGPLAAICTFPSRSWCPHTLQVLPCLGGCTLWWHCLVIPWLLVLNIWTLLMECSDKMF